MTAGQELTATLRRYFHVGPRSRRYRKEKYGTQDLHHRMVEGITHAAILPGFYAQATEDALKTGFGAAISYDKHVKGCRIDGALAYKINTMTPWHFAAMLGQMVDAGVTCTGEGGQFFAEMAKAAR